MKMWKQGIDKNLRNKDNISDQVLRAPGNRTTEATLNAESESYQQTDNQLQTMTNSNLNETAN